MSRPTPKKAPSVRGLQVQLGKLRKALGIAKRELREARAPKPLSEQIELLKRSLDYEKTGWESQVLDANAKIESIDELLQTLEDLDVESDS